MPVPTDITAGTLTITNGSTAVTGTGTSWLASDLRQGDIILWIEGGDGFQTPILADVPASNTALTLAEPWEGPTLSGVRYRIRYQWDSSRVSAQSRQLIEMLDNGNVLALSGLTGPGVPVFDGPHSMVIRPETDFINGVAYDVQVDDLVARAAYDGQAEGFAVLVSDVGDGRSALYSKVSNAVGDWSDPAYITGGVGPTPDIEATVTNTAPGTTPTVTPVPITGGTRLDFTLPEASGFYNAGVYDTGTAYDQDDVVRHNGSSFIALQAVPAGQSPSSAFPPVDTAYWQVFAAKGQDGTGTGDVVGPVGATNRRLVVFDGTTGKLITQSAGLSAVQQNQARVDLAVNGGVGNFRDLRNTLFENGVPSELLGAGTVFGFARGGSDGLGIPNLPGSHYGVLRAHGQYADASAPGGIQREFNSPAGTWRQYATSGAAWGPWIGTDAGWELIGNDTLSNVATWSRTNLSAYRKIRVVGFVNPVTDMVNALLRTSSNNGTSYDAGASDYTIGVDYHQFGSSLNSAQNSYDGIYLNWVNGIGNNPSYGVQFDFTFEEFNQGRHGSFMGRSFWTQSAGNLNTAPVISGRRVSTSARNAVRLVFSSGNILFGQISITGVRG